MKITVPISALAAILGFALAGSPVALQAQTTSTPAAAPAAAKPKSLAATTEYAGVLTAIDPSGKSITVTGTKRTLVMAVTAKTKYHKDTPSLSKFAVGDHVTGSYTTDSSGALTAYSIHKKVKTSAAKPATAAAPAPAAASTPVAPATP
jgi:Cu/Ag efflux protein CusF